MSCINGEINLRHEKKNSRTNVNSRGGRDVGRESQSLRDQQERVSRTYSQGDNRARAIYEQAAYGGIIDLLIDDYRNQEAAKLEEIKLIRSRIEYLESLKNLENKDSE